MWKMLTGVWPRMDSPETAAAWWGLIGNYPAHHATAAVRKWTMERRIAPTPADIIDGVKIIAAESRQISTPAISSARCDECDGTGFVWTSMDGHGTVRRCVRGCKPPIIDHATKNHHDGPRANPQIWTERMNQKIARDATRRREIGERAYLEERGIDPDAFTYSHGVLIARPNAR
jgi:hypothetical protein